MSIDPPAVPASPVYGVGFGAGQRIWFYGRDTPAAWQVRAQYVVTGDGLPTSKFVAMTDAPAITGPLWSLGGVASNLRYTRRDERTALTDVQAPLGRETAHCAVLIPISKNADWWAMAQDERLEIYARSAHTAIGMDYLPAVARQLFHCRDLGGPFDFLTWFEFAPAAENAFLDLLSRLRATEEWRYVDREIEIWLTRAMT